VRLRHSPTRVQGKASPDPELGLGERLQAARLYVITPDRDPDWLVEYVSAVLRGGAEVIQLRHKTLARGRLLELARRLRDVTSAAGALLIVNDHADIARLAGADGVHLGPDDLSLEAAKRVGGDRFLIGASASSPGAATSAVAARADYIGSGAAFPTPLKPDKSVIGPPGVAAIVAAVKVPVFAIGGIDESNVSQLTALGINRVCVIRGLGDAPDPESAARRLRAMLDR
jgi:thiamine-phosphate pyrophosphorylase